MDNLLVYESHGKPMATSRKIAEVFNKKHDDVLKSIRNLIDGLGKISESDSKIYFELSKYKNKQNKNLPEYLMSRDAFSLLAMSFTGDNALKWKLLYISAFNKMEEYITVLQNAKSEFPEFTDAINQAYDEPKPHHFSNEMNMIYRIVLNKSASEYRNSNGLDEKVSSIRPYLTLEQIQAVQDLQRVDIGLLLVIKKYSERKAILEAYYKNKLMKLIA